MTSPHQGRPGAGAWRPSPSQARLLVACLEAPARHPGQLDAWCRHYADRPLEPDTRSLLPFVFGRLSGFSPHAGIVQQARAAYLETSWQNLIRVARLRIVLRRFEEAGIPAVLLKGAALALRYYRNFGMRSMADIDLLVHPADVRRAAELLAELGWTASGGVSVDLLPTRMRVQHAWPFGAAPLHSLDLHWRLNVRAPEVDEMLWGASETFEVGSTTIRALSPTDQVFHVCTHAVQPTWSPSPRWIIDVMTVLDAPDASIDWERMVDLARRTNTTVRLEVALAELEPYASERIPSCVMAALRSGTAPRWERRELAQFERIPPFRKLDVLRWHWYLFRRLRPPDPSWSRRPMLVGFVEYVHLYRQIRGSD